MKQKPEKEKNRSWITFRKKAEEILSKIDGWTYPKKRDIIAQELSKVFKEARKYDT